MIMRMKYTRVKLLFMLLIALGLGNTPITLAYNTQVLLSQVQVRNYSASDPFSHLYEAIVIKNDSEDDADITNWCVYYFSVAVDFSDGQKRKIGCFVPENSDQKIFLKAGGIVRFASFDKDYFDTSVFHAPSFSQGLGNDKGKLVLLNNEVEQDRVEWGTHPNAIALSGNAVFGRKQNEQGILLYSGVSKDDFEIISQIDIASLSSVEIKQDICPNLAGFQLNESECIDETTNTTTEAEAEPSVPTEDLESKEVISHTLQITEYFPNPAGSDVGNEFIELYNYGLQPVSSSRYSIAVESTNSSSKKTYKLPDTSINPGEYLAIYNIGQQNFALNNTAGKVSLAYDSKVIDESSYASVKESYSWSLIGDNFVLSVPSPNAENLLDDVVLVDKNGKTTEVKPCAADQERNPATGRCRKIPSIAVPTPCKAGQERNITTGRCRNIANTQKTPTPCKVGQERNPATGRCRNIKRTTPPKVGDSIKPLNVAESSTIWIWAIAGAIIIGAIGYIVWEWRYEIKKMFKKLNKPKNTKNAEKKNKSREDKNDL